MVLYAQTNYDLTFKSKSDMWLGAILNMVKDEY